MKSDHTEINAGLSMLVRILFGVVLCVSLVNSLHAKTYIREYTYMASEADSKLTSRAISVDQVKVLLLNEIGTHIRQKLNITKDGAGNTYASEDVVAVTAGLTKVEVLEEKWDGVKYYLKARIEADEQRVLNALAEYKKSNAENSRKSLDALKENERELQRSRSEITRLRRELKAAKSSAQRKKIVKPYMDEVKTLSAGEAAYQGHDYYNKREFNKAAQLLEVAAKQGYASAQYKLAGMYVNGEGVEPDEGKAFYWFLQAAEKGYAYAQILVGVGYTSGQGVEPDSSMALYWHRKAAEQGNFLGQYNLGMVYMKGKIVERDFAKAAHWFRLSAKQEIPDAQTMLGALYAQGSGVEQSDSKAVYWLRKAAELDHAPAQFLYGLNYIHGRGVEQSYDEAAYWFKEAAKQGNADAQYYLGQAYIKGRGVEESSEKALYWTKKSALQGHQKSIRIMQRVSNIK